MTAAREALALPLVFLTVTLLGGLRIADAVALLPPSLFALVLSVLLLGLLVRCGALAPNRLVHASRSTLANVNGLIVMLAAFLASAQAFNVATPGYFGALRIPLVRGRHLDARDGPDGPRVAVISNALAARYWRSQGVANHDILPRCDMSKASCHRSLTA